MPDDRLIHLTLGHSAKINSLTDFERLVWLMYKLAADDFGVMRFSAVTLREAADWLSKKPERTVQKALEMVSHVGLIDTFRHQGRTYCYQWDWQKWQKIAYPRHTINPAPSLDSCDRDTQWLLSHHPKGGKLPSWKAPESFKELSRKVSGKFLACICVGVCVCVGTDQNLPTPKARRDSSSVENLLKTERRHDETTEGLQADRVQAALRGSQDATPAGTTDRRCGMEGTDEGSSSEAGIRRAGPGDAVQVYDQCRERPEADRGAENGRQAGSGDRQGAARAEAGSSEGSTHEQAGGMGDRPGHDGAVAKGLAGLRAHVAATARRAAGTRYH